MSEPPLVSFVIPCYRHQEHLENTLSAIRRQASPIEFEILVVCSGWESMEEPISLAGEHYLVFRERLLPGAARNRGASATRGHFLAFVDADAAPGPDWLNRLVKESRDHPMTMVGGFVGNSNPQSIASRVLHCIEFSQFLPGIEGGAQPAISTSNCLLPAELFRESGGFDEKMAMSEDWEFCSRLPQLPRLVSSVGVLHSHRSDWDSVKPHLQRLGYWSGWLRRTRTDLSGSWLRTFPPACWGLILLRFYRIWRRMGRARPGTQNRPFRDGPRLLVGLWVWTSGFWIGIRGATLPKSGS